MSVNWGPHFIVPSETLRAFSGKVLLRENFDEELLKKILVEVRSIKAQKTKKKAEAA